ncbi:MAPEG family protein [Natronospira bacteriovora]|uniref:MAPEG family protein n=1 Tax=Natronospira bacteriovora TaxID=3069753 RepID=A0ABU0W9F7_9GAMM|nr:MAPEG family protein [Natronospira sp. AB-CW4]MDQ2070669.1 MAPEG family protein [Natronospira sp. AB-CW4]
MWEAWGLVGASLLFALAWFPASVAKQQTYGTGWLASNRDQQDLPPMPRWGERAIRAHENLKENFPAWAALVLLVIALDWQNAATAWAAVLFPLARLGHMASYIGGWFWPRFLFYCVGIACTLILVVVCLLQLLS